MLAIWTLFAMFALYVAGRALLAYCDLVIAEHVAAALGPQPVDLLFVDETQAPLAA